MVHNARPLAALAVTLLAVLMGGQHGATLVTVLIAACAGAAFVINPTLALPRGFLPGATLLALAVAAAFLPAAWFSLPSWRLAAEGDYGLSLASTLTPQPWKTAEAALFLMAALTWLCVLLTTRWTTEQRRHLTHLLMGALSVLGLVYLGLRSTQTTWPWNPEHAAQYGPFANRNQLATLCGMSLALHASYLASVLRKFHLGRLLFSLSGVGIATAVLVWLGSRGGFAIALSAVCLILLSDIGKRKKGAPNLGIALSLTLLGCAALFFSDTRLAERLTAAPTQLSQAFKAGRLSIYQDTVNATLNGPITGHGLGNFASIFPFYREASVSEFTIRHPESDWLWWWNELGWPLLLLLGFVLMLVLRHPPRWRRHRTERLYDHGLRRGLLCALGAFALHSLVDVPAHRIGSLWPALLIVGLLWPGPSPSTPPVASRLTGRTMRWLPLGMLALACGFLSLAPQELSKRSPLAWQAYFAKAQTGLHQGKPAPEALTEFLRARFLEPHSALLPLVESEIWLQTHPTFAVQAWQETLRREPLRAKERFDRFLRQALTQPGAFSWPTLAQLAGGEPALTAVLLNHAPKEAWDALFPQLKLDSATLLTAEAADREAILAMLSHRMGHETFRQFLEESVDLKAHAAPILAQVHARNGDWKRACHTLLEHTLRPPTTATTPPLPLVRETYQSHRGKTSAVMRLIEAYLAHQRPAEALPLLEKLESEASTSPSIRRLRFFYHCTREEWEAAWRTYQGSTGKGSSLAQANL